MKNLNSVRNQNSCVVIKIDFDQSISLRKGEVIQVTEGWTGTNTVRANTIYNVTANQEFKISRGLMVDRPQKFQTPLVGRVISTESNSPNHMVIYLEEGTLTEDFVFVRAGEVAKGIAGFKNILAGIHKYLKICDPYLDPSTITLLQNANPETHITILTKSVPDVPNVKKSIEEAERKRVFIKVHKVASASDSLHGRYFISENGAWSCDCSLKDIGQADTLIIPIPDKAQTESNFDDRYNYEGKKI